MLAIASAKLAAIRQRPHPHRLGDRIHAYSNVAARRRRRRERARRGRKTARLIWGNQASVLVGDFLLGQAFRMLVDVGSLPVLKILSNAAATIAEGEVMQLAAAKNTSTTEDEYLAIINAKTAALFSAAAEVGAAIANRPAKSRPRSSPTARISASPFSSSTMRWTIRATASGSANRSATISAKARSRYRSSCRSGAARTGTRVLEPHHRRGRNRGRRSRTRDLTHEAAQSDRSDDGTGAFLRRDRARCASHISRRREKDAMEKVISFCISRSH